MLIFPRSVLRPPKREPGAAYVLSDLLAILLTVVVIAGAATGQSLVAALGATALVVTVVARLWSRLSLENVVYLRELSESRVFAGDELQMVAIVENRKPLPLPWLRVRDVIPDGVELAAPELRRRSATGGSELILTTSVARQERVRSRHALVARRRGYYRFGPAMLESGDLFGLYTTRKDQDDSRGAALIVYPVPLAMPDFNLPAALPLGDARSTIMVWADPNRPSGAREYRPGDAVKSIDWKASARLGSLHVKTYEPSVSKYAVIVLEASTADKPWDGYLPDVLEACVTAAASIAVRAVDLGYQVGLITNGVPQSDNSRTVIPPAAGPGQLTSILESLAMVRPMTVRSVEEIVSSDGQTAFHFGTTVIYVAGVVKPGAVDMLVQMASAGRHSIFMWVGHGEPPAINRVTVTDGRRMFGIEVPEDSFKRPPEVSGAMPRAEERYAR